MLGGCAAGTSEFMPSGMLPELASELDVSIPLAGMVVSVFAVGMVIGALGTAIVGPQQRRKAILVVALSVVAIGHLLGALSSQFSVLLASRLLCAVAIGVFWTIATELAVAISPQALRARAIARLASSMVVANVLGVPLGAFLSSHVSWRLALCLVAAGCLVAVAVLAICVSEPSYVNERPAMPGGRAGLLLSGQLVAAYVLICIYQAAVMALLTFTKPLFLDVAKLRAAELPWILAMFGVGGFLGLQTAGRYADRRPQVVLVAALAGASAAAVTLWYFANRGLFVVAICMTIYGVAAFAAAPSLNMRAFELSKSYPVLASGGNTAAFNVGNIIGPSVGGIAITSGGNSSPALIAGLLGIAALMLAVVTPVAVPEQEGPVAAISR